MKRFIEWILLESLLAEAMGSMLFGLVDAASGWLHGSGRAELAIILTPMAESIRINKKGC